MGGWCSGFSGVEMAVPETIGPESVKLDGEWLGEALTCGLEESNFFNVDVAVDDEKAACTGFRVLPVRSSLLLSRACSGGSSPPGPFRVFIQVKGLVFPVGESKSRPGGLEPPTYGFEARYSIQLS